MANFMQAARFGLDLETEARPGWDHVIQDAGRTRVPDERSCGRKIDVGGGCYRQDPRLIIGALQQCKR
jgi:hypothetical protein